MANPANSQAQDSKGEDEMLSTTQVAKMYGVSDETVRRWCKKGVIAFKQVGPFRLKRITRAEADRHLRDVAGAASEAPSTVVEPPARQQQQAQRGGRR